MNEAGGALEEMGPRTTNYWTKDNACNRAVAAEVARREHDSRSSSSAAFQAALGRHLQQVSFCNFIAE